MELAHLPARGVRAVLTDLDDTLTLNGVLPADAYHALVRLKERGLYVALVSGRPAGWADCLVRLWPLDAMIFENGAGYVRRDGPKLVTRLLADDGAREAHRRRLRSLFDGLARKVPGLHLAKDQSFRLFDFAIDYAEEPPFLTEEQVELVLESLAREPGIVAKLSSIHVNYWCGEHTKVTAADALLAEAGLDAASVVYCGDSPNDEPLFARFEKSVGVANVASFLPRLASPPRYVTREPGGLGFAELVAHLLAALT